MSETWIDSITRIYREAIAEAGPDGADRQEVMIVAGARVATEVRSGRLAYELNGFIHSELLKVDESDGKRADSIIRTAATGQGSFEFGDLDVSVILGKGRRKLWRDVTADDLRSMNEVRYANYQNVKKSYEDWYTHYRLALPVLVEHITFGAAVDAGGFPPKTASAAAAA